MLASGALLLLASSCRRDAALPPAADPNPALNSTADPAFAQTLQADVQATAASVATLPITPTATDEPLPTFDASAVEGVPASERRGECPVPEGYVLHSRQGFCLAAPATWLPYNIDGGMAVALNTTPGQAISLRPDWASTVEVCHLLIYIAAESSALAHLEVRHAEFAARTDLQALSPVILLSAGGMALPGFTWIGPGDDSGAIYADMLGSNRIVHISLGGTQCSPDRLSPVLETLNFE